MNEIILFLIDWNMKAKLQSKFDNFNDLPLMLLTLPPGRATYQWRDVYIKFMPPNTHYLWRYISKNPTEFAFHKGLYSQHFFPNSQTITFRFDNGNSLEVNVNDVLRQPDNYLSIPYPEDQLPHGCYSLMDDANPDKHIDEFVKDNTQDDDQPFVFVQTTESKKVIASCWTKSSLEQMASQQSARFYECKQENQSSVVEEQEYVKLNIFGEFQTFITKENYEFLIQSDNIYFQVAPKPFYYVPYSILSFVRCKSGKV